MVGASLTDVIETVVVAVLPLDDESVAVKVIVRAVVLGFSDILS